MPSPSSMSVSSAPWPPLSPPDTVAWRVSASPKVNAVASSSHQDRADPLPCRAPAARPRTVLPDIPGGGTSAVPAGGAGAACEDGFLEGIHSGWLSRQLMQQRGNHWTVVPKTAISRAPKFTAVRTDRAAEHHTQCTPRRCSRESVATGGNSPELWRSVIRKPLRAGANTLLGHRRQRRARRDRSAAPHRRASPASQAHRCTARPVGIAVAGLRGGRAARGCPRGGLPRAVVPATTRGPRRDGRGGGRAGRGRCAATRGRSASGLLRQRPSVARRE